MWHADSAVAHEQQRFSEDRSQRIVQALEGFHDRRVFPAAILRLSELRNSKQTRRL